ncbi:MAG: hypothetical protein NXI30_05190 [bacterium]|nr:hypothetical protein [bacterium]
MSRGVGHDEREALAAAWPRALIEAGLAQEITDDWLVRTQRAAESGLPAWPRYALDDRLVDGLFEVRRARRLVRGLDGAAEALDREQAGLSRAAATRPSGRRISRLLLLGADGADRFYRQAARLAERHAERLAVVVIEADEAALGEALYGPGKRVRAALVDHKDAVIALLERLLLQAEGGRAESD